MKDIWNSKVGREIKREIREMEHGKKQCSKCPHFITFKDKMPICSITKEELFYNEAFHCKHYEEKDEN